ncbi:hypothetical protein VNO78_17937 [Psophocarpus tetragonolobus]|uniref:Protein kinase domain-containing protein n=1 Tax=Psophocarpus tetragonolobus TaxID=3891 RepID=A0AAN9XLJ3_PSOTE
MNRGLEYLYEHCHPAVIHRDMKSSNILLEANFNAKLILGRKPVEKLALAHRMCTKSSNFYLLRGLSEEDSLSLFVKLAFKEGEEKKYPQLL